MIPLGRARSLPVWATVVLTACEIPTILPPQPSPPGPGSISGQLIVAQAGTTLTQPAAGASVQILGTSISTTADAIGLFTLQPVTQTSGSLLIGADPNSAGVYQRQRLFDLSQLGTGPGVNVNLGTVTLNPNATITGTVVRGDMAEATTGQGGTTVFVPEGPFTTTSADDGSYVLDAMPEGTVTLEFFRDGYAPDEISGVQLSPGQDLQLSTVILQPMPMTGPSSAGTVSGSLVFAPPVTDVTKTTATAIGGAMPVSFPITSSGTFSVGLNEGVYSLTFSYPGYATATVANVPVLPGSSETLAPITVAMPTVSPDAGPIPFMDGGPVPSEDAGVHPGRDAGVDAGPPPGIPPVASISALPVVRTGGTLELDGTGSDAYGEPAGLYLSYDWIQTEGDDVTATFTVPNNSVLCYAPTFTAPDTPQTLGFTLTVTDIRSGLTDSASITIQVVPPPTAVISPVAQGAFGGAMVTFDGSGSSSAFESPSMLQYVWSSSSPAISLGTTTASSVTFAAPSAQGTYAIDLVVSDLYTSSDPAQTSLTVFPPGATPSVVPGQPQTVPAGSLVTLSATAVAPDMVTWSWTQTGGANTVTVENADSAAPSFTAPSVADSLTFQATATNANGSGTASVFVTVTPVTPTVAATASPQIPDSDTLVTLVATGMSPAPLSYAWVQTAGPTVTLAHAETDRATFTTPPYATVLQFEVTATTTVGDAGSQTATASVSVPVADHTPLVIVASDPPIVATMDAIQRKTRLLDAGEPDAGLLTPDAGVLNFDAGMLIPDAGQPPDAGFPGSLDAGGLDLDGGSTTGEVSGPWLMAYAEFNKPLAETTVTSDNVYLMDSSGTKIDSVVKYISGSFEIRVLPLVPLVSGSQYSFVIGPVTDTAAPPNVHATQIVPYSARSRTWTTWTSGTSSTLSEAPNPGIAASDSNVYVFSNYSNAAQGAAVETPVSVGQPLDLIYPPQAAQGGGSPSFYHRGFSTTGALYNLAYAYVPNVVNATIWWMDVGMPTGLPLIGDTVWPFTDGESLFANEFGSSQLVFWSYQGGAWGPSGGSLVHTFCNNNGTWASGTGANGQLFVQWIDLGQCTGEVGAEVYVATYDDGQWALIAGPLADDGIATFNGADTTSGVSRGAMAAGAPVFVWSDNNGAPSLNAAALSHGWTPPDVIDGGASLPDAGPSATNWNVLNGITDVGASPSFDIVGRGNVLYIAYVVSGGLYLRQIDFTDPSRPGYVDIQGPSGPSLNVNATASASHPELANIDGTIYVTWAELTGSSYIVQLRALQ